MKANWLELASEKALQNTVENLRKNGFEVEVLESGADALKRLQARIPQDAEVMTGSSTTLHEIGFTDYLNDGEHGWVNLHAKISAEDNDEKRAKLRRQSVAAEYYIASANALTEDGKVVAVDNSGSRVSAFPFAAEHLLLVVGTQKITTNLETAMKRIREYVLPLEDKRAQKAYGTGSYTSKWVILEREIIPGRVTIFLVPEVLGF